MKWANARRSASCKLETGMKCMYLVPFRQGREGVRPNGTMQKACRTCYTRQFFFFLRDLLSAPLDAKLRWPKRGAFHENTVVVSFIYVPVKLHQLCSSKTDCTNLCTPNFQPGKNRHAAGKASRQQPVKSEKKLSSTLPGKTLDEAESSPPNDLLKPSARCPTMAQSTLASTCN